MTTSAKWFWLSFSLVMVGLLYLFSAILTPFFLAALLAYLGNPCVTRLAQWKIPRALGVVLLFVLVSVLLALSVLLLIPLLEKQMGLLITKLLQLLTWLQQAAIPWLTDHLGLEETFDVANLRDLLIQNWQQAGGVASYIVKFLSQSGLAMVSFVVQLVLVPVVTFYLLRDWDKVIAHGRRLLPRAYAPTITRLALESDSMVMAFFRGQLLVMLALGVLYSVGLWLVDLELALLIGMIAGLVSIVPYLGFFTGIVIATIAGVFQFGEWLPILLIWLVFAVGSALESAVLTPNLVGDRIGIHPVAVIFSVLAGGQLFGFLGILLALPVAAVLMVLLRYGQERYMTSTYYQADSNV